jgi:hypothetical protein
MNKEHLKGILSRVASGELSPEAAGDQLASPGFDDLGFARIDSEREQRCGFPEVVFCPGKTPEQVAEICALIYSGQGRLLATRAVPEQWEAVRKALPRASYNKAARTITAVREPAAAAGPVHIVTGGTSDIPVAEEAAETAAIMGGEVRRLFDVGVAGIHRLINNAAFFEDAKVVIVAAGMEGALPSAVGGLVRCPVIAVPTSVGYGAHFNGLAALLAMLNSCASNVVVTNIDNGFRAGYVAALILKGYQGG